jgi:hypothetical protein
MIVLKHKPLAEVDEIFLNQVKELIKTKQHVCPPRNQGAVDAMKRLVTKRGMEDFVTRLRRLDYTNFTCVTSNRTTYLKATTNVIETTIGNRNVNIGEYWVYISFQDLLNSSLAGFHFIPERLKHPKETEIYRNGKEWRAIHQRHLHHYAKADSSRPYASIKNPLTYGTSTCWNTFGALITTATQDLDIVDMYRTIYLFLKIQNLGSPLVSQRSLSHYQYGDGS